jgi:tetratricopeptide (TPR) repeat protein
MAKADPAYASGLANFYINQKQYDKAFALFEEDLKKNPEDMMATYQIGKTSALSGQRLERGEVCLKKYLTYQPQKNEPSHAGANMRLAQIMEKAGKKTEAKKLYEVALKADATLKEAKEGLERVSK